MPLPRFNRLVAAGLTVLLLQAGHAFAAEGHWARVASGVGQSLDEAEALFAKGDAQGAKRAINDAYFARFEDTKLEAAIRKEIGARRAYEIEKLFGTMRKAAGGGDASTLKDASAQIRAAVVKDASQLDAAKIPPDVFQVNQ
jgi:hypothetical protein